MTREELIDFGMFFEEQSCGEKPIMPFVVRIVDLYLAEKGEKKEERNCRTCKNDDCRRAYAPCDSCDREYSSWQPK